MYGFFSGYYLINVLTTTEDECENRLSSKIQEHADRVFKELESASSTFEESLLVKFNIIKAELFITKMRLSILENDIEMAKFYEERAGISSFSFEQDSEVMIETTREIYNSSLSLYNQKRYEDAIYFLNRATTYLAGLIMSTNEYSRVKQSVHFLLVRSCIEEKSEDSIRLAENLLLTMQESQENFFDYYKLSIKLINVKNGDPSEIEMLIMRMLISNTDPSNLKTIIGIINDFATKDRVGALNCLEFAFTNKADPNTDQDSLEIILISMINLYTKSKNLISEENQVKLTNVLDIAEKKFTRPLSRKCSSSAITLLWNIGKSNTKNNEYEESIGWFKLALHKFLQVNEVDKAKIQRAIQNSLINLERYDEAIEVYDSMSEQEKKSSICQYNMFKVYSYKKDEGKLTECLKIMCGSSEENMIPLLSLCAVNPNTNTRVAIQSMMLLFKNINSGIDSKVSIPTALRYVIELILKEDTFRSEYLDTLLNLLKEAYKFANDSKNLKGYLFSVEELQWFSAQAFNIARECLLNEDFVFGSLFAEVSTNLNLLITEDISLENSLNLKLWRFKSGLINLMCESKKEHLDNTILWGSVREKSLELRLNIEEITILVSGKPQFEDFKQEWEQCLLDCMIFQYKAELKLENWSAIEAVLRESERLKNIEFDTTLVNIVVDQNEDYPERIKSLVSMKVLQRNFGSNTIPASKISRWVRILLKYNTGVHAEENCLKVLEQIYTRLCSQEEDNQFPAHEVEWISTTCWNNGIGRLFSGEESSGRVWCEKAMKLSRFVNERFESTLSKLWDELQHLVD